MIAQEHSRIDGYDCRGPGPPLGVRYRRSQSVDKAVKVGFSSGGKCELWLGPGVRTVPDVPDVSEITDRVGGNRVAVRVQ